MSLDNLINNVLCMYIVHTYTYVDHTSGRREIISELLYLNEEIISQMSST